MIFLLLFGNWPLKKRWRLSDKFSLHLCSSFFYQHWNSFFLHYHTRNWWFFIDSFPVWVFFSSFSLVNRWMPRNIHLSVESRIIFQGGYKGLTSLTPAWAAEPQFLMARCDVSPTHSPEPGHLLHVGCSKEDNKGQIGIFPTKATNGDRICMQINMVQKKQ